MTMQCQKCGASNRDNTKFCLGCGVSMADQAAIDDTLPLSIGDQTCPQCLTINRESAKFCRKCGFRLTTRELPADPDPAPFDSEATLVFEGIPKPMLPPMPPPQRLAQLPSSGPLESVSEDPNATQPMRAVQDFDLGQFEVKAQTAPACNPLPPEPPPKGPVASAIWLAVGTAVLLLVIGAGAWFWSQRGQPPDPLVPAPVVPAVSAPVALPPPPPPVVVPATSVEPVMVTSMPQPESAPIAVPATPATPATANPVAKAPPLKPVVTASKAVVMPKVSADRSPVRPPASEPVLVQTPAPPVPEKPAGPASPREACGSRVFLALSFCMNEQCNSTQFKNHPQCVELRQQQKESAERLKGDR